MLFGVFMTFGECSILAAELEALAIGLKLCWQKGCGKIWAEIYSKAAVSLPQSGEDGPWEV